MDKDEVTYTVNGETSSLQQNNGTYSKTQIAPGIPGVYDGTVKVTKDGRSTVISSKDPRFNFALRVNEEVPHVVDLKQYIPEFMAELAEMKALLDSQSRELDYTKYAINRVVDNNFLETADEDAIERIEKFLGVKPKGTLQQRKDYLKGLYLNGIKTNKARIEEIVKTITGGEVLMKFYASDEADNPNVGHGYLEVKVMSPSLSKDYNFENVARTIKPLIAAHLKLSIMKWFATWEDIKQAYASWDAIKTNASCWDDIYTYTPPR